MKISVLVVIAALLFAAGVGGFRAGAEARRDLRVSIFDSPATMSIHEEFTIAAQGPAMGVFNNLVMYDQHVAQTGLNSIVPDLATNGGGTRSARQLTFRLRQGVKWHDGKPFTAKDVKCTFDLLLGTGPEKLRLNPRKPWYRNLERGCRKRR